MRKILILMNLGIIISISGCNISSENASIRIAQFKPASEIIGESVVDKTNENILGDDIFSKRFELEGSVYSVPFTLKKLEEVGWKVQNDSLKALKSGEKNSFVVLENNSKIICVSIENDNLRDMYIENCVVNGILVQNSKESQTEIKIPGNITIGSTNEEVESAFKELINGDQIRESADVINYAFSKDGFSVSIIVDKSTDKVYFISLSEI